MRRRGHIDFYAFTSVMPLVGSTTQVLMPLDLRMIGRSKVGTTLFQNALRRSQFAGSDGWGTAIIYHRQGPVLGEGRSAIAVFWA